MLSLTMELKKCMATLMRRTTLQTLFVTTQFSSSNQQLNHHSLRTLPLQPHIETPYQPPSMLTILKGKWLLELHLMVTQVATSTGSYHKVKGLLHPFAKCHSAFFFYHLTKFVGTPPLTTQSAQLIDTLYQNRKETLLSVDDLVKEVVSALEVCPPMILYLRNCNFA